MDWRKYGREAVRRGTRVEWGQLPAGVGGRFERDRNVIVMSEPRLPLSASLAAMVSHEVMHACQRRPITALDCLTNEIYAYAWEAYVYAVLPNRTKPRPDSEMEDLVAAWQEDRLRDYVIRTSLYQRNCLGGELPQL